MSVAERLVASERWEWRSGMEGAEGHIYIGRGLWVDWDGNLCEVDAAGPRLFEASTAGHLHAMLREALPAGFVDVSSSTHGHKVTLWDESDDARHFDGECLGEALGEALLWAWSV